MASERTKAVKRKQFILVLIDLLLSFGPVIGFAIYSWINGSLVAYKTALTPAVIIVIAMTLYNIKTHANLASPTYIFLLIVYLCVDHIVAVLWIMAITTFLDELIVKRWKSTAHTQVISNKEMDKRLEE